MMSFKRKQKGRQLKIEKKEGIIYEYGNQTTRKNILESWSLIQERDKYVHIMNHFIDFF